MKILDLNNNCLEEFPAALEQLARLEELNVNSNKISKVSIQTEGALPALKYLYINDNGLFKLDVSGKASFSSLRVLTAVGNEMGSWPDLTDSRRLRELQLANNCVSHIGPSVSSLRLLRTLDMSNNRLNDLPAEVCVCARA
jgi:leucine-rich repeat protein SHOC2